MIQVEGSIVVKRSPREVFEFAVSPATSPRWQSKLLASEKLSEGPLAVGSRLLHTRTYYGRRFESTAEIIDFVSAREYRAQDAETGPFAVVGDLRCEAEGQDTRVSYDFLLEPRGRFLKVLTPFIGAFFTREVKGDFRTLKALLESGGGSETGAEVMQ